jgi:hypothetical protein
MAIRGFGGPLADHLLKYRKRLKHRGTEDTERSKGERSRGEGRRGEQREGKGRGREGEGEGKGRGREGQGKGRAGEGQGAFVRRSLVRW